LLIESNKILLHSIGICETLKLHSTVNLANENNKKLAFKRSFNGKKVSHIVPKFCECEDYENPNMCHSEAQIKKKGIGQFLSREPRK
jgi:hypothetical protein